MISAHTLELHNSMNVNEEAQRSTHWLRGNGSPDVKETCI